MSLFFQRIVLVVALLPLGLAGASNPYHGMSDHEFARLRVQLPPAKRLEWKTFTTTRSAALETPDSKLELLSHLPTWIRLSLRDDPESTAGFLDTLLELQRDKDARIQFKATLELYRLGDYQGRSLTAMKELLTAPGVSPREDPGLQFQMHEDILRELLLYRDHRLDETIYQLWLQEYRPGQASPVAIRVGIYLDKAGKTLPTQFWSEAAEASDSDDIFDALLKHHDTNSVPTMKKIASEKFRPHASRAAAILYLQTKDDQYLNRIASEARRVLQDPSIGRPLAVRSLFVALGDADPTAALPLLGDGLASKNLLIREACIHALGRTKSNQAADTLFDSAIAEIKAGVFPANQLKALIQQGTEYAGGKYQRIKALAMNPDRGFGPAGIWTESDFSELEFRRKWGYPPR